MRREIIATGKSVEDAINSACAQFACEREQLDIEVLELPIKKMLGFLGSSEAKIKAIFDEPEEKVTDGALDSTTSAFLTSVLERMGAFDIKLKVKEENGALKISIEGEGLGPVIGRRGETLDSLQYLVSLVANRGTSDYRRITLDSGDYREKREQTLERIAKNAALGAVNNRRNTTLEPMNPYERRIIHSMVQNIKGSTSWSIGEEPYRRVVIGPDNGKHDFNKANSPISRDTDNSNSISKTTDGSGSFKRERKPFVSRDNSAGHHDKGAGGFENNTYLEKYENRRLNNEENSSNQSKVQDEESYQLYQVIKPSKEE
jgi:spoIIIJ-associated protein